MPDLDDAPEIIVVLGGGLLPDGSPDFLRHNVSTLEGLDDGDLAAMFDRLVARWPEYARHASRFR